MNHNLTKHLVLFLSLCAMDVALTNPPPPTRNLTIRHNLYCQGDVHIDPCRTLFVNDIEPNPTGCSGIVGAPISIGGAGLNVPGNACIQGALLCNQIDPVTPDCVENERCSVATNFSGDIKIRDTHTMGKLPHFGTIRFNNNQFTPVIGLNFNNCNTDVGSSSVATGALIKLKLYGIAKMENTSPSPVFFDLLADITLLVGPDGYSNNVIVEPIIASGLNPNGNTYTNNCLPTFNANFCYGFEDPCALCIGLSFSFNCESAATFDYLDAFVTYDIVSDNLTSIDCECSSVSCP